MLGRYGRQLAANRGQSVAASGFFGLFYRWSRAGKRCDNAALSRRRGEWESEIFEANMLIFTAQAGRPLHIAASKSMSRSSLALPHLRSLPQTTIRHESSKPVPHETNDFTKCSPIPAAYIPPTPKEFIHEEGIESTSPEPSQVDEFDSINGSQEEGEFTKRAPIPDTYKEFIDEDGIESTSPEPAPADAFESTNQPSEEDEFQQRYEGIWGGRKIIAPPVRRVLGRNGQERAFKQMVMETESWYSAQSLEFPTRQTERYLRYFTNIYKGSTNEELTEIPPFDHLGELEPDETESFSYPAEIKNIIAPYEKPFHPLRKPTGSSTPIAEPDWVLKHEPDLSTSLRQLMRTTTHSVVVLTTLAPPSDPSTVDGPTPPRSSRYRGMTLSSFTTLTLTPSPIITFNIRAPSRTLDALKHSRHFLIHVLAATQSGVNVAEAFTKGKGADAFKSIHFRTDQEHVKISQKKKKRGVEQLVLPLVMSTGIIRVLKCQVLPVKRGDNEEGFVKVGDHELVLAKVHSILPRAYPRLPYRGQDQWPEGLSYAHGKYRRMGSTRMF
jgi:flavin reductase (DIM6/NTAB) family NADH-FMN oxidoreductase RutF